ncbi:MAG: aminotransferase class I/II-fold pyridoxal phosphate-dependent enzyme [Eubacteriales bacterium]|nr:aminotransferase class I/II-fold pyridoxal phosphate-dependent enzyme [Eubacteriales bacterium]
MESFIRHKYRNLPFDMMASLDTFTGCYDDIIDFSLGDLDLTTDHQVIEQSFRDALKGHTHYTNVSGDPDLVRLILQRANEQYQTELQPENLLVTTSGSHALCLAMLALLEPQDEVIILEPYFSPFAKMVDLAEAKAVFIPCPASANFLPDLETLRRAINSRTKALILNSPNNPTGRIYPQEVMEKINTLCREQDVFIISDEVYAAFDFADKFCSQLELDPRLAHSLIAQSFSKTFAMTGWRLGFALGPPPLIAAMKSINEGMISSAPSISQRAALYALKDDKSILGELKSEVHQRLETAWEEVRRTPKMQALPSEGGIYLFISIKETGLTSAEAQRLIFDQAHVLLYPGCQFGPSGEGYLRLAASQSSEEIRKAFHRIRHIDIFH